MVLVAMDQRQNNAMTSELRLQLLRHRHMTVILQQVARRVFDAIPTYARKEMGYRLEVTRTTLTRKLPVQPRRCLVIALRQLTRMVLALNATPMSASKDGEMHGMFQGVLWRTEEWRGLTSELIWNRLTYCKPS